MAQDPVQWQALELTGSPARQPYVVKSSHSNSVKKACAKVQLITYISDSHIYIKSFRLKKGVKERMWK